MVFTRVGVVFSVFIFIYKVSPLEAQCKTCQTRDFAQKSQTCICPENQYCNTSTLKCANCDRCYDTWNDIIKRDKADVESILKELVKRYEVDLDDLKKLLQTLTGSIKRLENEIERLKLRSGEVGKKIPKVNDDLKKLKKGAEEIEDKLKRIGKPQSIQDVLTYLKEVIKVMKDIAEKLKKLNLDYDDIRPLDVAKLKNIEEEIKTMNKNFPKIERDSLNLALSLESDLDLLESLISKVQFGGNNTSENNGDKILENTKWIEKDLLWLFSLINSYGNVFFDIEGLQKNAFNVRLSAEMVDFRLNELLKKQETFERRFEVLKNETEFYKELENLVKRLQNIKEKIKKLENLLMILRRKQEFSNELDEFLKERNEFDRKEINLRKYKPKLEKLYQEKLELVMKYNENERPVDEIEMDIKKMRREIIQMRRNITEHCSSSSART